MLNEIIEKILGDISIQGETNHDNKSIENLDVYETVVKNLIEKIINNAEYFKDNRFSAKRISNKSIDILRDVDNDIQRTLELYDEYHRSDIF